MSSSNHQHRGYPAYPSNPITTGGVYGNPSNQGQAINSSVGTTSPSYGGLASAIGIASAISIGNLSGVSLAEAPKFPTMQWGPMDTGSVNIAFHEEESGAWVKAVLAPAFDLTACEALYIQLLIAKAASTHSTLNSVKPLTFIRARNLERHFNISLA